MFLFEVVTGLWVTAEKADLRSNVSTSTTQKSVPLLTENPKWLF